MQERECLRLIQSLCPLAGKVLALELRVYMDGGAATDNTLGDMDMAMLWADNVYYFPNYHAKVRTRRQASILWL